MHGAVEHPLHVRRFAVAILMARARQARDVGRVAALAAVIFTMR